MKFEYMPDQQPEWRWRARLGGGHLGHGETIQKALKNLEDQITQELEAVRSARTLTKE